MTNLSYATLSINFAKVKDLSASAVGKLIGGKVEWNMNHTPGYNNACAIRMSYAFNYSGLPISRYDGAVNSGKDKKWYLYKVEDIVPFIRSHISNTPIKGRKLDDFKGGKGIIVFFQCGWRTATGHVDLFNGTNVEGDDYFHRCGYIELYELQ